MSTQETKPEPRRPKLRLPFDNRREDAGEWAFDHRAGLCVTLIAYLLLAIAFVGAKIVVGGRPAAQGFYIDLQQLEQLAAEKERLEREVRRRQQQEPIDWTSPTKTPNSTNRCATTGAPTPPRSTMRPTPRRSGCAPTARPTNGDWPKPKPSAAGGSGPTSAEKAPTARCRAA